MTIDEIMTSAVEFVHPEDPVDKVAQKMVRMNVGSLPVLDEDQNAVGIITDRDITTRVVAAELVPGETEVRTVMTHQPLFCKESDDIQAVAKIMQKNQVRRLLVQNDQGDLTGVVSLGDLALNTGHSISGEILEEISKPPGI